jgi:hypothetical protein
VKLVPAGRRPGRFAVEFLGLAGLVGLCVGVGLRWWGELNVVTGLLLLAGFAAGLVNLANVSSVPEVDEAHFEVRYGPWTRTIRPERVAWIRFQGPTRTFVVRERGRLLSYRFAPVSFVDGDGLTKRTRQWAKTHSVTIRG